MRKFLLFSIAFALMLSMLSAIGSASSAQSTPSTWAARDIARARQAALVTEAVTRDFRANITREQFCELAVRLYERLTGDIASAEGNVFTDTDNPEVIKAYNLGIVVGVSATRFAPDRGVTRQEIAVMLVRLIDLAVADADVGTFNNNEFADIGSIAGWALPSVQFAYDNGIIRGVGGNRINPLGPATCEQAILLVYRVYLQYRDADGLPQARDVYSAYYDLLTDLVDRYGISETVFDHRGGLFKATLVDIDNDGVYELVVYYSGDLSEPLIYSGYLVYGYDQATGAAVLIADHRGQMLEDYQVSIFMGQHGDVFIRNRNGQSHEFYGDYSTLEDGAWVTALTWTEAWEDLFEYATFTIDGRANIDMATAMAEFRRFEAELIFEFELYDWETNDHPRSNVIELIQELALKST